MRQRDFITKLTAVVYYKAMLSLMWIVSRIRIADALLRPDVFFHGIGIYGV